MFFGNQDIEMPKFAEIYELHIILKRRNLRAFEFFNCYGNCISDQTWCQTFINYEIDTIN